MQPEPPNQIMTTNTLGVVVLAAISAGGRQPGLASVVRFWNSARKQPNKTISGPTAPQDAGEQGDCGRSGAVLPRLLVVHTPNSISAGFGMAVLYLMFKIPDPLERNRNSQLRTQDRFLFHRWIWGAILGITA